MDPARTTPPPPPPMRAASCGVLALVTGVLAASLSPVALGQAGGSPSNAAPRPPLVLQADEIRGEPDGLTEAKGTVRARQGELRLDAPSLTIDRRGDTARAEGGVIVGRQGDRLQGPKAEIRLDGSAGRIERPSFHFANSGAGGTARELNILDSQRVELLDATITSCLVWPDGRLLREPGTPVLSAAVRALQSPRQTAATPRDEDALEPPPQAAPSPGWTLQARRILLDDTRQEGTAEHAVLRFQGLPLLVLPRLSFPLGDARRSGWLPPTVRLDSRSGLESSVPYYLNLAPNLDATVVPVLSTRRGPGVEGEFRYLLREQVGQINAHVLPHDGTTGTSRSGLRWSHDLQRVLATDVRGQPTASWSLATRGLRVSDDTYWKDFGQTATFHLAQTQIVDSATSRAVGSASPDAATTLQPRLLDRRFELERQGLLGATGRTAWSAYARVQQWQVLQGVDTAGAIAPPYAREPQIGLRMQGEPVAGWGLKLDLETELNRFRLPGVVLPAGLSALQGQRWHAMAAVSRPWRSGSGWLVPRLRLQTARYETDRPMSDGRLSAALTVPSFSVDGGLQFERPLTLLGRPTVQTLEPRVVYVNTPFRDQATLPNFDAAPKDFNSISIFSDRAYSGIDRVADAHQVTAGVSTRVLDAATGAELLRASAAQRLRLSDQQITPDNQPGTQRWSDLLLAATVGVVPNWSLDSVMQYSPERSGVTRSVLAARYTRTAAESIGVGYRYARDASEALELRWLWPLWRAGAPMPLTSPVKPAAPSALTTLGDAGCRWQVGSAGRLNYSLRDGRLADSLIGVEVDTGCWIGRVGVQRQSTGLTEAVTRLILQLELLGLSRSGGNPFAF